MLLITAAFVALLMAGLPYARGYLIRENGLDVTPETVIPPKAVRAFLQNDARWSSDKLGDSEFSLGGHGCLVCCIASSLCGLGIDTDPKSVNEALAKAGAYTPEGEVVWNKLKDAFGAGYSYRNDFSAGTLEKLLQKGLLPIVRVKYKGTGAEHWVLLVGSGREDFLALDPLEPSGEPIPLKTHGRVYAYRVLEKATAQAK